MPSRRPVIGSVDLVPVAAGGHRVVVEDLGAVRGEPPVGVAVEAEPFLRRRHLVTAQGRARTARKRSGRAPRGRPAGRRGPWGRRPTTSWSPSMPRSTCSARAAKAPRCRARPAPAPVVASEPSAAIARSVPVLGLHQRHAGRARCPRPRVLAVGDEDVRQAERQLQARDPLGVAAAGAGVVVLEDAERVAADAVVPLTSSSTDRRRPRPKGGAFRSAMPGEARVRDRGSSPVPAPSRRSAAVG